MNTAFQSVYDTTGSTDITINKEDDNISEVHSQVGSELRSAFSSGYSVSTNADIHVNYRIANPTANIRFGGGGTGTSTISAAFYDYSDYFGDSDYSEVDEDIPVIKERSKKEKENIWTVDGYEINSDGDEDDDGSESKEIQIRTDSTAQPAGSNIEVKVDLAPTIKIEGSNMDENKIFEIIKSRCRELADDIGGELADKLAQSYSNMPLTGET